MLLGDDDRRDEREAASQVARKAETLAAADRDEQEEHRADTGEEKRRVRRESDQDRDQERRAEHGENVLDSKTDRLRPGQTLIRGHHLRGWDVLTVSVYLPEAWLCGHGTPLSS